MATKSNNKKNASAPSPSINPKAPSDKKPKPWKPTEEQPEEAAADKKLKKQKAKDEIGEIFDAAKASKKRKGEEAGQGDKRKIAQGEGQAYGPAQRNGPQPSRPPLLSLFVVHLRKPFSSPSSAASSPLPAPAAAAAANFPRSISNGHQIEE
ncbi:hypothetical protein EJB05_04995, partial [Eragrostis curvula]